MFIFVRRRSENIKAICEKTAGLRSGNFSDLDSACLKMLVPVKIFQLHHRWICLGVYSSCLALTKESSNFIIKSCHHYHNNAPEPFQVQCFAHSIHTALQAPNDYELGQQSHPKPQQWDEPPSLYVDP